MELIQIHTSEPIWTKLCTRLPLGLEEVVGYVWTNNISTFPPFRRILLGASAASYAEDGCRRHSPPLLRYMACWCDVTDVTCTARNAYKMRGSERNACVWKWKPDETGRKWIMDCTYNCIAFIQIITKNLSNFRPSSFRMLSRDNTFFRLLNLSRRSSEIFRWRDDNTVLTTLRVTCTCVCVGVCVCRKPQCLHETFFDLLNLFRPFWEMFRKRHDNTVIHASHMGNYMLYARGSETLQTFTFRPLTGKVRTSVTFQTDGNITISLHVFAFLLIVVQDIVFIHDAAFFMHVRGFA